MCSNSLQSHVSFPNLTENLANRQPAGNVLWWAPVAENTPCGNPYVATLFGDTGNLENTSSPLSAFKVKCSWGRLWLSNIWALEDRKSLGRWVWVQPWGVIAETSVLSRRYSDKYQPSQQTLGQVAFILSKVRRAMTIAMETLLLSSHRTWILQSSFVCERRLCEQSKCGLWETLAPRVDHWSSSHFRNRLERYIPDRIPLYIYIYIYILKNSDMSVFPWWIFCLW